jgi:hypothetical protein
MQSSGGNIIIVSNPYTWCGGYYAYSPTGTNVTTIPVLAIPQASATTPAVTGIQVWAGYYAFNPKIFHTHNVPLDTGTAVLWTALNVWSMPFNANAGTAPTASKVGNDTNDLWLNWVPSIAGEVAEDMLQFRGGYSAFNIVVPYTAQATVNIADMEDNKRFMSQQSSRLTTNGGDATNAITLLEHPFLEELTTTVLNHYDGATGTTNQKLTNTGCNDLVTDILNNTRTHFIMGGSETASSCFFINDPAVGGATAFKQGSPFGAKAEPVPTPGGVNMVLGGFAADVGDYVATTTQWDSFANVTYTNDNALSWPPFAPMAKNRIMDSTQSIPNPGNEEEITGGPFFIYSNGAGPVFGVKEFFQSATNIVVVQVQTGSAVLEYIQKHDFIVGVNPMDNTAGLAHPVTTFAEPQMGISTGTYGTGRTYVEAARAYASKCEGLLTSSGRIVSPDVMSAIRRVINFANIDATQESSLLDVTGGQRLARVDSPATLVNLNDFVVM